MQIRLSCIVIAAVAAGRRTDVQLDDCLQRIGHKKGATLC